MLEASRLTRTRQLLKATAVIQQTLREALEPDPTPEDAEPPVDESFIEGSFRVVEPDAEAEEPPGREPDLREVEVTILTRPTAGGTETSPDPKQPPTQPVDDPSDPPSSHQPDSDEPTDPLADLSELSSLALQLPRRLRAWKDKLSSPTSSPTTEKVRYKGQFLSQTYTNEAGSRSYKLYIPSGYQGQAWPLVVLLHGCTQSPDDIAAGSRMNELAESHGFLVLYPAQTFKANKGKCWNWFKTSEQQRDQGEPAIIAGLTRQVVDTYGLDKRRVYITGISAGGAMAVVMGTVYPDLYAAMGVQSGLAYGLAHNIPSGLAAMKRGGTVSTDRLKQAPGGQTRPRVVPTIVFHGDADGIVNPTNSDQIIAQWLNIRTGPEKPHIRVEQGQVPGGHSYTRSIYHDGSGPSLMERWLVHGAGHAWSGGSPNGSWTDPQGPDASREMIRFFYEHPQS